MNGMNGMMKKMKKWLACGAIVTASAVLLAGCGGQNTDKSSGSGDKIVAYGVIDPQISAQQIIADKKGYFKEEGLNVENKFVQAGGDISPLISGGEAQVSFESPYTDTAVYSF